MIKYTICAIISSLGGWGFSIMSSLLLWMTGAGMIPTAPKISDSKEKVVGVEYINEMRELSINSITSQTSDHSNHKKKLLVVGYVKAIATSLNKNNWDLSFLMKTVYSYYNPHYSLGDPFFCQKEKNLQYQDFILTSLAPCDTDTIITCRRGEGKLKKWRVKNHDMVLDSEIQLACLLSSHMRDMVFLPPRHLFIRLEDGRLGVLNFLDDSLTLTNEKTKGWLLVRSGQGWSLWNGSNHNRNYSNEYQVSKMVYCNKELLILESTQESCKKILVSGFYIKNNELVFKPITVRSISKIYPRSNFLIRSTYLDPDEIGYSFSTPFFVVRPGEKHINNLDLLSTNLEKSKLFLHKDPEFYKEYDLQPCCYNGHRIMKQRSLALVGQVIIFKNIIQQYCCVLDAQLGITFHKVCNLGRFIRICNGFYINQDLFILVTRDEEFPFTHHDLLPKHTNSKRGVYQVMLMKWTREAGTRNILKQEYRGSDDFIEVFCTWLNKRAGSNTLQNQVKILSSITENESYRKKVARELWGENKILGFKNQHLKALKRTKKRVIDSHNLQATVIDCKVTKDPVCFSLYTGTHVVGMSPEGLHIIPIKPS